MDIRMRQAEALYMESKIKSSEAKEGEGPDKTVSAASASETETVSKTVKLDQTTGLTGVEKAGKAVEVRRPSYDKFVPEKSGEPKSYGHYQPVSDGKGGIQIQFDAPEEAAAQSEQRGGPGAEQAVSAEEGEQFGQTARNGNSLKDTSEAKKTEQSGSDSLPEEKLKLQKLKNKKKQLEQKIKNAADSGEAEKLRRKLAQVKRELSGAVK